MEEQDAAQNQSESEEKKPEPKPETSKYEMNLAEFPLVVLSKNKPRDLQVIEYQDTITGKNGEIVPRKWMVSPSVRHGFGSPQLLSTLFELIQAWKEDGFESKNIHFGSIYQLVKKQGLKDKKTAYDRVRHDLAALVEMSFEAKNAFWDSERQAYVDKIFHLFESVHIYHSDARNPYQDVLPFSYIEASNVLWQSIQSNPLLTININRDAFHSYTPTEQKLALYLAKMLRKKNKHWRDVELLGSQLPILAKRYKDKKKLLSRACDGLIEKKFPYLTHYTYQAKEGNRNRHNIYFYLRRPHAPKNQETKPKENHTTPLTDQQRYLVMDILEVCQDDHSRPYYERAVRELPDERLRSFLSETRQAFLEGRIYTTRAKYFTDLVERYRRTQPTG